MKKNIIRIISIFLITTLFLQNVFASDVETTKEYAAETIGRVPKQFQRMVNGNWAIASGEFSEDGYYHFNADDGKVQIDKYNIYGKKQYTTEYDYKYAGKDNFGFNYRFNNNLLRYTSSDGSAYVTSHTLRSLVLLNINLSSKSVLTKIGSDGEILWQHKLNRKDGDMFSTVTETPDGNVVVSCSTFRKFFGEMANSEYTSSLILLDSSGEKIHNKKFEDGIMWFSDIVCVGDNGFFAIAKDFAEEIENTKTYLCALDYEFNILWEYEINDNIYTWNGDDALENGYPVIAKKTKDTALYQTKENTVIRIDFDKNVLSKHTFKTKNENEYVGNIWFLDNGDCIVEYGAINQNGSSSEDSRCVRYSKGFRNLGEIQLPGYSLYDVLETKNEIIFCCWNALSYYEGGGVDDRECVYTAFDKDWNLLWQKGVAEK